MQSQIQMLTEQLMKVQESINLQNKPPVMPMVTKQVPLTTEEDTPPKTSSSASGKKVRFANVYSEENSEAPTQIASAAKASGPRQTRKRTALQRYADEEEEEEEEEAFNEFEDDGDESDEKDYVAPTKKATTVSSGPKKSRASTKRRKMEKSKASFDSKAQQLLKKAGVNSEMNSRLSKILLGH